MSDNDLISREKLLHTLEGWLKLNARIVPTEIGKAVYMMIENYPAVPREMSAKEYIATLNRMCGIHYVDCEKCPLETENNGQGKPCSILQKEKPEVSIAIVEKWEREHPEMEEGE